MAARIVRVEGNKLWIRVKEEPAVEQAVRVSPSSSRESRTVTPHRSRVKEEPADNPMSRVKEEPTDIPMEQDPHPRILRMTPQPAKEVKVSPLGNPYIQVKRRAGFPVHRDWPKGFHSEPQIPKVEPHSPRVTEQASITFHHVEEVLANWQHRFDTITQDDKTVEEYFVEFMLLRKATRCAEDPDAVLLRFWKGLRTEFHVALGGSTYLTAAHLADDAARLEKMGRSKETGTFGGLGDPTPAPPAEATPTGPGSSRPAEWPYFLNAYRTHADLRINPNEEVGKGTNGWLEESDEEADLWGKVKPEWERYRDSPPSATTPVGTLSG
ncbi:hypothetical protein AALP_AAs66290U000100 [Arabis alpina]|uniref:Retrotransposon gag domain-containing protein n=1 Tax=Arabis alpina TaxID=50452 RepID=A0A087G2Y5_ARAAL|nr:hypothetical protein AALP_AAs66290U000100 [Arabis alpina]